MTEELDILQIVANNPEISQRKIASQTGISLGQVNFLIKKFVKKGLIKVEGQTSKSLKYNLTPKGFSEKAALTLEYIKISYIAVMTLTDRIELLVKQYNAENKKIYLSGSQDEMRELIKLALNKSNAQWEIYNEVALDKSSNHIIICWEDIQKQEFTRKGINVINILE